MNPQEADSAGVQAKPKVKKSMFAMLKDTAAAWMKDRALNQSAALAYYSIFSIAPLIIIAIGVAGLVFGPEAAQGKVSAELRSYIGTRGAQGVESLVQNAAKPGHGWMGAITGFATLLIGASGVFAQLKEALNTIWAVEQKPGSGVWGFIRERLLSFGMVLVIGFLLLVSLVLSSIVAGLSGYMNHFLGLPQAVWASVGLVVSFSVVTLLFATIFKILPDAKIQWRDVWVGAAATAALFEVGKFGLSFYLGRESTASSYGAAGSVILVLLWIYYASCILLFGAEFTRVYALSHGRVIQPAENAQPASTPPAVVAAPPAVPGPHREHLPVYTSEGELAGAGAGASGGLWSKIGKFLGFATAAFVVGRVTKKSPDDPVAVDAEFWNKLEKQADKAVSAGIKEGTRRE